MSIWWLLLASFSLAMDAFAVSVTNGLCYNDIPTSRNAVASGLCFGTFQAVMPFLGFAAGSLFKNFVESIDHWIALILLGFIGINMIVEAIKERNNPETCPTDHSAKTLVLQGVATSIDAFAVGIGFAVLKINILTACLSIGVITFVCSYIGVYIGKYFGGFIKDKAQLVGGAILVFIGLKIFLDHTILL